MDSNSTNSKKPLSEKRLQRACDYVSDLWFPVNPELLGRLRETLKSPADNLDINAVIEELRGDYSLFIYCLKELCGMLRDESALPHETMNPMDLLRYGGIEKLRTILATDNEPLSRHSFDHMDPAQRRRIEDSLICASAAQVLAEQSQINSELGFSAGLLRQVGLTLIAWNYPMIYEKARKSASEERALDTAIAETLGFSPQVLATALAHRWGLPEKMCESLTDQDDDELPVEEGETEAIGTTLASLCRIGELLARANNPEDYPAARKDWVKAQTAIVSRLGPDGLATIQSAVNQNCHQYTIAAPNMFKPGTILDPENRLRQKARETMISANPFLQNCSPRVREQLEKLYEEIARPIASEEALKILIHEIVPLSGFSGTMVYTIEPSTNTLVAQLVNGNIKTRQRKPVIAEIQNSTPDLVTLSFNSEQPVTSTQLSAEGIEILAIASLFGYTRRIGVLFSEIPAIVYGNNRNQLFTHFRAFAAALNHCLGI